ncbi:MAG: hypothetical protein D6798_15815 [Deltaproteobacteria bacterium]|nr:MAG: hypothetical protein D6798_15815 [Deltaproteobacteria bacterium]
MPAPDLTPEQQQELDRLYALAEAQDLYGLLGVHVDADANEIQQAYYALSRKWHPDRFFRKDLGEYAERLEIAFVMITQAYKTLTDPMKRRQFNRENQARLEREAEAARARARRQPRQAPPPPPVTRSDGRESIRDRLARNAEKRSASSIAAGRRIRERMEARVRARLLEQLRKARTFYETGLQDMEAGRVIKAAGAFELACQYDPHNETYRQQLEVAKEQARAARIAQLVVQGEQAESYQQVKQAIHFYRQAVELGPTDGKVYHRLGNLVRLDENDDREALALFRNAVKYSPDVPEFRMSLGELYQELGLRLNARREFQAVLELDPNHEGARAALKSL